MRPRVAEQVSIAYFASNEGGPDTEGQAFLFTRDLPSGVMPIGGARNRPDYAATLEPESPQLTLWLAHLLNPNARRGGLAEALVDFVESATQYLAHFGQAFYEIVPSPRATRGAGARHSAGTWADENLGNDGLSEPRGELPPIVGLVALPPGKVWRVPRRYLQIVPKGDRKRLGKRFVPISIDRIWRVELPAELGSPRAHRRLLTRLERLDPLRRPDSVELADMGRSIGFDFTVQRAAHDIEQERVTKGWGRIPSIGQIDRTTEYLFLARILQWRRSQALIREHVISELNGLLARVSVSGRIVVNGLPSAQKIDESMRAMRSGEITVAEAMDATKL